MGKPGFVRQELDMAVPEPPDDRGQWLLLARSNELLAWFQLHDEMRSEAPEAVDGMRDLGLSLSLLSGDRAPVVAGIARRLGIEHWQGGASPEGKLAVIREGQRRGERLLMVGDGINDAPVLGAADVSVAMGDAANLTRLHADSLLLSGDLRMLPAAVRMARRTRRIIAQNLSWALAYNGLALPLAAAGWVPPWAAAIGMSASSLLVVINALRLGRGERSGEPGAVPAQPPALSAG
jgi:Cu2+-exporting ATPase